MGTSETLTIVELGWTERDAAAELLTAAFAEEPWLRWAFAEHGDARLALLYALQAFACDIRLVQGWPLLGVQLGGRLAGVAGATVPGSGWPDELDAAWQALAARFGPQTTARLDVVAELEHAHRPPRPAYEIGVIGVHPDARRRGAGSALLAALHERARQTPGTTGSYLATTDSANLPFYHANGYRKLAEATIAPGVGFWALYRQ